MIELRTQLNTLLRTLHAKVYFQHAPDTAEFPFVTYDLPTSNPNEEQEIFILDVDVWDDAANTTALETLASSIWNTLRKYRYIDADIQFTIHRDTRLAIIDDDPRIKRRRLVFQVRYFDRRLA